MYKPTKSIIDKLETFEVEITKEEYQRCEKQSTNMWANQKTGLYGSGLANSEKDPRIAERYGNLGEIAFAKVFGLEVDFSYKLGGDKQDFILLNASVNVKNATHNYGAGLICAISEKGRKLPLNDIYVFSFTANENRNAKQAKVIIVGWELKDNIIKRPTVPARKGNHRNYDIPYNELKPISKLYNLFLARQISVNDLGLVKEHVSEF